MILYRNYLLGKDLIENSKKFAVYGASFTGERVCNYLIYLDKEVACFLDDTLSGNKICGIDTLHSEELPKVKEIDCIVIAALTPDIYEKMFNRLVGLGIDSKQILIASEFYETWLPNNLASYNSAPCNWKDVMDLFEDSEYKRFAEQTSYLEHMRGDNINKLLPNLFFTLDNKPLPKYNSFLDRHEFISKEPHLQYRLDEIGFDVEEGDVVIDCGAASSNACGYKVHTHYFAQKCGVSGHVYAFEPIDRIYQELAEECKVLSNVSCWPYGVWSGHEKKYFLDWSVGSNCIQANENNYSFIIDCLSIDEFVDEHKIQKVDFIKMDVEGAELEALKGAIETINKFKPKLAISIYHYCNDFIEIPKLIKEFDNRYKLYLINNEPPLYTGMKLFAVCD